MRPALGSPDKLRVTLVLFVFWGFFCRATLFPDLRDDVCCFVTSE